MIQARLPLGAGIDLELPDGTEVLGMPGARALADPAAAIREALAAPIGAPSLAAVARSALSARPRARAVVVVSDSTRPVPYSGPGGILWPVVETLLGAGYAPSSILILVATGTHRAMSETEMRSAFDPRAFELGIEVRNHDCRDATKLSFLGKTRRGGEIWVDSDYVEAGLKIATGLVESHFMAGASGGRKSICPGLVGERSTFVFHGARTMMDSRASDLVLEGNPCHEEAIEAARAAGCDFIVNVTLDHEFRVTGVFAGDLEKAHAAAVERLSETVGIPFEGEYDIAVTHAGFVGVNHYQAAKAAVAAAPLLRKGGHIIMAADNTDVDPVGSPRYKAVLALLREIGPDALSRLLLSPDWTFIPEQWQVQMWIRAFSRAPMGNFRYFAPQLDDRDWQCLPGVDGRRYLAPARRVAPELSDIPAFVAASLAEATASLSAERRLRPRIALLRDGPYGIPIRKRSPRL